MALNLELIYGFEMHLIQGTSLKLPEHISEDNLLGSIVLLEEGITGLNYPSLIDTIKRKEPRVLLLLGDRITRKITPAKLQNIGCDAILPSAKGFIGVNNCISSALSASSISADRSPFDSLKQDELEFLSLVHHKTPSEVISTTGKTQQRVSQRKNRLFRLLCITGPDKNAAFSQLARLYGI